MSHDAEEEDGATGEPLEESTKSRRPRIARGGRFGIDRTTALSDGVFAIALTLLVLQLRVPSDVEQRQYGSLAGALLVGWRDC
jgi:hypothetical protein